LGAVFSKDVAVSENFFEEQTEQSQIKAAIVSKYFWAWAKIITGYLKGAKKDTSIQYIDLFAGPGRYRDGAKSTPILILEQAVADPLFRDNLTAIFNDKDDANTSTLMAEINAIPDIDTLASPPRVYTNEVGDEVVKMFEQLNLVPTLMFVDPWGYSGLSLRLINSVLKDWACECIFFFNYNRINMGLSNKAVKEHMEALFGEERAAELSERLKGMPPGRRELTIVEEICQAVKQMGGKFVLPFTFKNEKGTRTSHHLIFVSKHPLGYGIMKEIMTKESSSAPMGVPTFAYNPAEREQKLLYGLGSPGELEAVLLDRFGLPHERWTPS
jgi:three-Cys-motif partner protein